MPPRDDLFQLYKIAIDEYRFEVRLNWDRTMYYLVFNTAVVSVATGLLKLTGPAAVNLFVAGVFLIGVGTTRLGIRAIQRGHDYYRRAIFKKTLLEDLLGFAVTLPGYTSSDANVAVSTTMGQADRLQILQDTDTWLRRPLRSDSITAISTQVLWLLLWLNSIGALVAIYFVAQPAIELHL